MKPIVVIGIAVVLLFVPLIAYADDFKINTSCNSGKTILEISDLNGTPIYDAKVMTIKELTGKRGYEQKYFTDKLGIVEIPYSENTGYVWIQKGGFNDQKLQIHGCERPVFVSVSGDDCMISTPIFLCTDKSTYFQGEEITITGKVDHVVEGAAVIYIEILYDGHSIYGTAVEIQSDGSYNDTLSLKNYPLTTFGKYTVITSYFDGKFQTDFELKSIPMPKNSEIGFNFESSWNYKKHVIPYTHVGGHGIITRFENNEITIGIDQDIQGYLIVGIPRALFNNYHFCEEIPLRSTDYYYERPSEGNLRLLKFDLKGDELPIYLTIRGTHWDADAEQHLQDCKNIVTADKNVHWKMASDDTSKDGVYIKNTSDYVDNLHYLHVIGEIVNNQNHSIEYVKSIVTIYDKENNILDEEFSFSIADVIPPYGKSPFDVVFTGGVNGVDNYVTTLEWLNSQGLPMELELVQPKISVDNLGYVHIKGNVENGGKNTANYVKVIGTLYDANKELIGISYSYTKLKDIYPKQTSSYDLVFDSFLGEPISYQLYVKSQESAMTYIIPLKTSIEEDEMMMSSTGQTTNKKTQNDILEVSKTSSKESKGGGCLIATATYGSELAPQVQQLRELRDNSLLQTESGKSFMSSFNDLYYSFSPTIADLERENPAFKEIVKITLTPMISSLSILNYVNMDSEVSVLGYGISLILLNVGMYFVVPGIVIHKIRKKF